MKNKIVLLSPSAVQGGAERGLLYLAERLPHYGFEPKIILLEHGPFEQWLMKADCEVEVMNAGRLRQAGRFAETIKDLMEELKGHAAVISNQSKGHIYGGLAAKMASTPEVWWQQQHASLNRIDVAASLVPSSVVVCSSEAALQAQHRLAPWKRVRKIHLGTPVEELAELEGSGATIRREKGWEGVPLVGIIGRLQPWKGQEVFLRAAALVAQKIGNAQFVVVGGAILGWEGRYPETLRHLSEELGIANRTHFLGHQPDVFPWFDALDVVVHASYGEPFDHVLIEAMALGRPLVAASKGGSAEIIQNGISGILVPAGDGLEMAKAIIHLLEKPKRAREMGREARKRASLFSAEVMAERFAQLLNEVTRSRSVPAQQIPENELTASLTERSEEELYDGPPNPNAMAAPFTHNVCVTLVDPPDSHPILDLGPGQGAFALRLRKMRYKVIALGISPDQFLLNDQVAFVKCDLDEGIPVAARSVSGIVAIEVIEHLEAPLRLFKEAARCLLPGGFLIISTPNVLNVSSRLSYLLRGHPIFFGQDDVRSNGHISPISLPVIKFMAEMTGLELETVTYNVGKLPIPKLRHLVRLTAPRFRCAFWGEILIARFRKSLLNT